MKGFFKTNTVVALSLAACLLFGGAAKPLTSIANDVNDLPIQTAMVHLLEGADTSEVGQTWIIRSKSELKSFLKAHKDRYNLTYRHPDLDKKSMVEFVKEYGKTFFNDHVLVLHLVMCGSSLVFDLAKAQIEGTHAEVTVYPASAIQTMDIAYKFVAVSLPKGTDGIETVTVVKGDFENR